MLDPRLLRAQFDHVRDNLARRGFVLDGAAYRRARRQPARRPAAGRAVAQRAQCEVQGHRPGRRRRAQDIAPLLAEVEHLGAALKAAEAELDAVQGQLHDAAARPARICCTNRCRTGGRIGQPGGAPLGYAAGVRFRAARSRGPGRPARPARFRGGRPDRRRALRRDARAAGPPAARPDPVHAGHPHGRARLHRGLRALSRQCREPGRHRAAAEVRGRPVRACRARPDAVPDSRRRKCR